MDVIKRVQEMLRSEKVGRDIVQALWADGVDIKEAKTALQNAGFVVIHQTWGDGDVGALHVSDSPTKTHPFILKGLGELKTVVW